MYMGELGNRFLREKLSSTYTIIYIDRFLYRYDRLY
jgi:hypothetical protein